MTNRIQLFIIFWGFFQVNLLVMGFKNKTNENAWLCLLGNIFFYVLLKG